MPEFLGHPPQRMVVGVFGSLRISARRFLIFVFWALTKARQLPSYPLAPTVGSRFRAGPKGAVDP